MSIMPGMGNLVRKRSGALIALLIFGLVGCGGDDRSASVDGRDAGDPVPGGTAVVALSSDPDALNSLIRTSSASGEILAEIQDGLADMGEDMTWRPQIATHWEIAADGLSITYFMRPWVWSDGHPLTATDVVGTFELIQDERVGSPLRGFHRDVVRAVALDSSTVRYDFVNALPDPVMRTIHAILPKHVTEGLAPEGVATWILNQQPLASGPFMLEGWERNRAVSLIRNPLYPGRATRLDRVVFQIIPEQSARVIALETGAVDLVDGLPPVESQRLQANGDVRIVSTSGRQYYYLLWNFRNPVFDDSQTRRALAVAIDRQRLIDSTVLGFGTPAIGPIPPVLWNHHQRLEAPSHDPEEARALLAAAGWLDTDGDGVLERDGVEFSFVILTRQGDPVRENGGIIIRENLREVGVEVKLLTLEHAVGISRLREGDFDAYFGRFRSNLFGDPSGLVHSTAVDRFNNGNYANATVDSLLETALASADRNFTLPIWEHLQEALVEDPPAAYLFCPDNLVGVSKRLQDVRPHLLSPINNLSEWWIAPRDRKYLSERESR